MSFSYLLLERGWDLNEWPEHVDVAHAGKVDHKRYVPERTCRNVYEERVHPMDQCDNGFMCSECGNVVQDYEHYAITGVFNYCPNCGAKVVEG